MSFSSLTTHLDPHLAHLEALVDRGLSTLPFTRLPKLAASLFFQHAYMFTSLFLLGQAALGALLTYRLVLLPRRSTLANLPGPDFSWTLKGVVVGDVAGIFTEEPGVMHERSMAVHGRTYRYPAIFGSFDLFSIDPAVLNHGRPLPFPSLVSGCGLTLGRQSSSMRMTTRVRDSVCLPALVRVALVRVPER